MQKYFLQTIGLSDAVLKFVYEPLWTKIKIIGTIIYSQLNMCHKLKETKNLKLAVYQLAGVSLTLPSLGWRQSLLHATKTDYK